MKTYVCPAVTSKTVMDRIRQLRLKSGKRVVSGCELQERSLVELQLKSQSHKFCWQHDLPSGADFNKKKQNQNRILLGGIAGNTELSFHFSTL